MAADDGYDIITIDQALGSMAMTNERTGNMKPMGYGVNSCCVHNDNLYVCSSPLRLAPNVGAVTQPVLMILTVERDLNLSLVSRFNDGSSIDRMNRIVEIPVLGKANIRVRSVDFNFCVWDDRQIIAHVISEDRGRLYFVRENYLIEIMELNVIFKPSNMQCVNGLVYMFGEYMNGRSVVGVFGSVGGRNVFEVIKEGEDITSGSAVVNDDHRIYFVSNARRMLGSFSAHEPATVWHDAYVNVRCVVPSGTTIAATRSTEGIVVSLTDTMTKAAR